MHRQSLDGGWSLCQAGTDQHIPAVVPGSVHVDLANAGVIPDPFFGDNEYRVAWVAETDWVYRRTFVPSPDLLKEPRVFLECDGLDTLATVRLNGEEIARTDNMHRRYSFDVSTKLIDGENSLEVRFDSPVRYAKSLIGTGLVITPGDSIAGSPYLRKAMYQWGWDWAPKLPTSGIWRPIRLTGYAGAKIEDIHIRQQHAQGAVTVTARVAITRFAIGKMTVDGTLKSPDGTSLHASVELGIEDAVGTLTFTVEDPRLWWPNGYGDQPLYSIHIELKHDDRLLDDARRRIGLRTIALVQRPDEWGKSFYIAVNGVAVWAKGADWVPADQFPSRITEAHYRSLIESCVAANMNMVRVWGGGIYEDDRFYNICDELGILVWQDFAFACAHYPMNPEMLENISLEAADNIRRLRHHASLALWCGNNEMEWFLAGGWGGENNAAMREEFVQLFYKLLASIAETTDPDTPYWPASPASSVPFQDPNGEREGDGHYWDVWHGRLPFTAYRDHYYRLMSEFGFESLPSLETVRTFAEPEDWNMTSYIMESHQKNSAGNGLILYYMAQTFQFPKDFPMTIYVSQLLQAEAMRYGVEHWRRNRNGYRCMGALYWQLNDCWPVASWASLEYSGHWKATQYYAKRFFAPVLLSAEETSTSAKLHVTNDLLTPFEGRVTWSFEKLDGHKIETGEVQVSVPAESSICVADLDFSKQLDLDTKRDTVLVYELHQGENRLSMGIVSFVASKHLKLPEANITTGILEVDGGVKIALIADKTARFVTLETPGYDVRFTDNYFDLPAGRSVVVRIENACGLTEADITESLRVISLRDSYSEPREYETEEELEG